MNEKIVRAGYEAFHNHWKSIDEAYGFINFDELEAKCYPTSLQAWEKVAKAVIEAAVCVLIEGE